MDYYYLLYGMIGTVFFGIPLTAAVLSRLGADRDRKYLTTTSLDELWAQTGMNAKQRERSELLSYWHNFFSGNWRLLQDGKDVGQFKCLNIYGATFTGSTIDTKFWTGSRKESAELYPDFQTNVMHFHDGRSLTLVYSMQGHNHRIEDGNEWYELSPAGRLTNVIRDGDRVGVYFRAATDARVFAVDKSVPNNVKAALLALSTLTKR